MYKNLLRAIILIAGLMLGLAQPVKAVAQPKDRIRVEVSLMDDFGFLLADYRTDYFPIEEGRFVYQAPPDLAGYTFATVNVLKLETQEGYSFRVNYFYTQDEVDPASLPDPVPMDEIPLKRVQLQHRPVWVSFIDEFRKELADSRIQTWDFFWETYVIPEPLALKGYGYVSMKTGMKKYQGELIPHFAFVYSRGSKARNAPSLIFEHLIEDQALRIIHPEETLMPATSPNSAPATRPQTRPGTSPRTKPQTIPDRQTDPETKPRTKPETIPQTLPAEPLTGSSNGSTALPQTQEQAQPDIKPDSGPDASKGPPVLVIGFLLAAGGGLIYLYFRKKA